MPDDKFSPISAAGSELSDEKLRPRTLESFVGQSEIKKQMQLFLNAAKKRGKTADHILLSGPPGLGKTTMAFIASEEMQVPMRITSGPAVQHPGDLASILSSLEEGEILFIDEIHRLPKVAEEMLYIAMEDFRVDVMVGKGPGATSIPLALPHFTVIGATTREGMLPSPLMTRFGLSLRLDYYKPEELAQLIKRSAGILSISITESACMELARRSRGTPRIANRLLKRVGDWVTVENIEVAGEEDVKEALNIYQVDPSGLDRLDIALLSALELQFKGGPVGLKNLAAVLGENAETIESVAEPYLIREGFMARTRKGRVITPKGRKHLSLDRGDLFHLS
ncbi:MAG: Holliday junction branch migration DNA helicase RuvB [Aeriscardovia sp.]|nr:Holliday junction branch migration DNA helicase RuvB [Aeriscardovia sp.]MBO6049891.1 Holliday junction branch migration DNA helicase RuvB [Aeriscardovia sp.]MBO6071399.1 Holliday junction branch migration DNA helicase RuvB [Aeriscardovia sp.]MBO7717851.1 Holliday junction branch migration DNA helicase RuvB [Aeriscardovia sp.]